MANGRADGTHKLMAPLPSVTLRYRDGRPDLKRKEEGGRNLILDNPVKLLSLSRFYSFYMERERKKRKNYEPNVSVAKTYL